MSKRLIWLVLGLCLAGLATILLWPHRDEDGFTRLMARGNGYLEKGDVTNAMVAYRQVLKLAPENIDGRLNLANADLLASDSPGVIEECQQALNLDHDNAAAYYLMGCAYMGLNQPARALQSFRQSAQIDSAVTALHFQMGLAHARLNQVDDAIREFETVRQFDPEHASVHYQLSQLYQRVGHTEDASRELRKHQEILAAHPAGSLNAMVFERCKYTQPRNAFKLEQPDQRGIPVTFVEATAAAFSHPANYHEPMAVLDYNHDGRNSLWVMEGEKGFRVLDNQSGRFQPLGELLPAKPGANYRRCLVGDLNNDRFDDVIVLGEQASHVFRFATNGQCREVTAFSGLKDAKARDGLLADLDFTGKLDLLAILPGGGGLRAYRNLGNFYFKDGTAESGLPEILAGAEHMTVEDWNNEDLPGIFVSRAGQSPIFYAKQRAGSFVETNSLKDFPAGGVVATGDLNNDLRPDLVVADENDLHIVLGGMNERLNLPLRGLKVKGILLVDYDNDGWLDVIAYGNGMRVWRNLGKAGFIDVTASLGLDKTGPVDALVAADFDNDGDTDLISSSPNGLHFWRNDGGNANRQLKLRLAGNRSNASALGVRVEVASGNWRAIRTLRQAPLEIGVGKHDRLDTLRTRWFDLSSTLVDVPVKTNQLTLDELTLPSGSCPYLYAWDGKQFKFVTDILGASPLGLPVSKSHFIEADPEEFLALGGERELPLKNGAYEILVTEELREVLYLDEAELVVVDHPDGTLVFPTCKLLPGRPFPPHELWTVRPLAALKQATRSDGLDVTEALATPDGRMVPPVKLREPQLRGLAEPFSVTMDFGELPADKPLVLILTGWLRFGGGMANIAASLDPGLPFPFPTLEAEMPNGSWKKIDANVGAPAGKTKTILVDLEGKLPSATRRLRLTTAFEIYWDSARLGEKIVADQNRQHALASTHADLHWRGFSDFAILPPSLPLTPLYDQLKSQPPWRRTPSGWCTRYGLVTELVQKSDDALVIMNGGDELALSFPSGQVLPRPAGFVRDFFLHVIGWDKDADFHVGQGWRVEPLPFHGMKDQAYGQEPRPPQTNDVWIEKYNTRWVGPMVLSRKSE